MSVRIVKVVGLFTEYYSPYFDNPYDTNEEFREWFDDNLDSIELPPAIYPLGDSEIGSDPICLADRITETGAGHYDHEAFCDAIEEVLASGKEKVVQTNAGEIKITPVTEMPRTSAARFEQYGPYAAMVLRTVNATWQ